MGSETFHLTTLMEVKTMSTKQKVSKREPNEPKTVDGQMDEKAVVTDAPRDPGRRTVLKTMATGMAAVGAAAGGTLMAAKEAEAQTKDGGPQGDALKNPYGGKPGGGIALPDYYRPTKYVTGSRANYFPLSEEIGLDEMRISFLGSTPFPPRLDQAGTCMMVELGNGDRFFFDYGSGCTRNLIAM